MDIKNAIGCCLILVVAQAGFVEAKCRVWQKCWWEKAGKDIKKTAEQVGREIEKTGGAIATVGAKVGNVTIKGISKAGDITVDIAGKAGNVVLKTGQAVVTSTGMTLLNTGGMILALTTGDLQKFKSCAGAVAKSSQYGISMVVAQTLEAAGTVAGALDRLVQIESISLEASTAELVFQGKTPKVSIAGSFLGKNFNLKDVQVDLSNPEELVADILELLIKLQ